MGWRFAFIALIVQRFAIAPATTTRRGVRCLFGRHGPWSPAPVRVSGWRSRGNWPRAARIWFSSHGARTGSSAWPTNSWPNMESPARQSHSICRSLTPALRGRVAGEFDLVVNNAGFATQGPFLAGSGAEFARVIAVDVRAVVDICHAFLPEMVERRRGAIVNVSSTTAFQPVPSLAVYSAAKAFVQSFLNRCGTRPNSRASRFSRSPRDPRVPSSSTSSVRARRWPDGCSRPNR